MSSSIDEKRSEPWANLLAGGVGGLACQVIGHPFDTVKVTLFLNISDVVFIDYVLARVIFFGASCLCPLYGISIGFPKVRLQTMKPIGPSGKMVYTSATDCFSKIVIFIKLIEIST